MNPEALPTFWSSIPWWVPGLLVIGLGLLVCFWGYKALKIVTFLLGFYLGAYVAWTYGPNFYPDEGAFDWFSAALILGLATGFLIFIFYRIGCFILGACLAVALTLNFAQHMQAVAKWVVLIIAGVVGGFLGVRLEKWTMTAATSILGAWHAVQGVFFLFKMSPFLLPWEQMLAQDGGAGIKDLADRPWYFWLSFFGLSVLGMSKQIKGKRGQTQNVNI